MKDGIEASSMSVLFSWSRLGQWPGLLSVFIRIPPPGAIDHVIQLPTGLPAPDSLSCRSFCSPTAATPGIRTAVPANGECRRQTASDCHSVHRCAENNRPLWSERRMCFESEWARRLQCLWGSWTFVQLDFGLLFSLSDLVDRGQMLFFSCKQLIIKCDHTLPVKGHSLSVDFRLRNVFTRCDFITGIHLFHFQSLFCALRLL